MYLQLDYLSSSVSQAAVSVKDAAGAVREVAQNILKALTPERQLRGESVDDLRAESDEEISCFEDEFSMGIDLPAGAELSGNVTPIPTTGELEELRYVNLYQQLFSAHNACLQT